MVDYQDLLINIYAILYYFIRNGVYLWNGNNDMDKESKVQGLSFLCFLPQGEVEPALLCEQRFKE
jgi:hypothetical protein